MSFHHTIDLPATEALFQKQIEALVMISYQNERPPQGLIGKMDWYLQGQISSYLKLGALTGKQKECNYFPAVHHQCLYHLLIIGDGVTPKPGRRHPLSPSSLEVLQKNLTSLKLRKVGISRSDFGNVGIEFFNQNLLEIPLWITL